MPREAVLLAVIKWPAVVDDGERSTMSETDAESETDANSQVTLQRQDHASRV